MSDASRLVATAGLVSVGVGSANSVIRNKRPPSSKFLIGSGVAFLALSMMADASPELAKGLAIGVATTVILGEGGGVLSYINKGEIDTQKRAKPKPPEKPKTAPQVAVTVPVVGITVAPSNAFRPDRPGPIPGMTNRRSVPYNR